MVEERLEFRFSNSVRVLSLLFSLFFLFTLAPSPLHAQSPKKRPPTGRRLQSLVREYLEGDSETRTRLRSEADRDLAPLPSGSSLGRLRRSLLKAARKVGPKLNLSGKHFFYEEERGKYIVEGKPGKALFIGLHGGGVGVGDAEGMAAGMGGGGWLWIFPEVLEKTELGWTTSGTDQFVLELIEAAKRTTRIDPNRIYVTGHSMGGYGSWTLGAHHADVFAGSAAYAGGPSPIYRRRGSKEVSQLVPGVIPNFYNLPILFFQSLDDPKVSPEANLFAHKKLKDWKKKHPGGFPFRYVEATDRGHDPPKEGYLPTQKWVAQHERNPRPQKFLWQPVLPWKKHFYWVYWHQPTLRSILQVESRPEENKVEVKTLRGSRKIEKLTLLLGPPLVDLDREIVVEVNGTERFRGSVERSFSTLLLTLPRNDPQLLFDARIDF